MHINLRLMPDEIMDNIISFLDCISLFHLSIALYIEPAVKLENYIWLALKHDGVDVCGR